MEFSALDLPAMPTDAESIPRRLFSRELGRTTLRIPATEIDFAKRCLRRVLQAERRSSVRYGISMRDAGRLDIRDQVAGVEQWLAFIAVVNDLAAPG